MWTLNWHVDLNWLMYRDAGAMQGGFPSNLHIRIPLVAVMNRHASAFGILIGAPGGTTCGDGALPATLGGKK